LIRSGPRVGAPHRRPPGAVRRAGPGWKWNQKPFEPKPGEGYKKGFSIPCAIGGGEAVTWEQSGAAIEESLAGLNLNSDYLVGTGPDVGKLPLVRMAGVREQTYKKGSTTIPVLKLVQWVDRPASIGGVETFDNVVANAVAEIGKAEAAAQRAAWAANPGEL
jgi:hypothetical protein